MATSFDIYSGLLIIVNYNQELELEKFLCDLKDYYPLEKAVFVDDGSTDNSHPIAESMSIKILRHDKNLGVGAAIRTGINYAIENDYPFVTIMSSNGKMYPRQLAQVIGPLVEEDYDYVTGSRFLPGGSSPGLSLFRRLAIPAFSWIAYFFLGRRFSDITCGFRAYKIDFIKNGDFDVHQKWLDTYELEYYIHYHAVRNRLKIKEVPVVIPYDHLPDDRKSKIKPIVDWWKMIRPFVFLKLGIKK